MGVALNKAGDCSCPDRKHEKWRLAGGATLAELYALREGHGPAVDREPVLQGQYL